LDASSAVTTDDPAVGRADHVAAPERRRRQANLEGHAAGGAVQGGSVRVVVGTRVQKAGGRVLDGDPDAADGGVGGVPGGADGPGVEQIGDAQTSHHHGHQVFRKPGPIRVGGLLYGGLRRQGLKLIWSRGRHKTPAALLICIVRLTPTA
jgi:hypothetical protein